MKFRSFINRKDKFLGEKVRIIFVAFLPLVSLVIVGIIYFAFELDYLAVLQRKSRYHDRLDLFVTLATSLSDESEARTMKLMATTSSGSGGLVINSDQLQTIIDAETKATNAFYDFVNGNSQFSDEEIQEMHTLFQSYRQIGLEITNIMASGIDHSATLPVTTTTGDPTTSSVSTTAASFATATAEPTAALTYDDNLATPTSISGLLALAVSRGRGGLLLSRELDIVNNALALSLKRVTDNALTRFRASIKFYLSQALSIAHMGLSARLMVLIQPSATGDTTTTIDNVTNTTQTTLQRVTVTRNINGLGVATKQFELLQRIANRILPTSDFTTETEDYDGGATPAQTTPSLPKNNGYDWAMKFLKGVSIVNFTTTSPVAQTDQYQRVQAGRQAAYQPTLNELDMLSSFLNQRMTQEFSSEGSNSAIKNVVFVVVALLVTILTIGLQCILFQRYLCRTEAAKQILMAFSDTKASQRMVNTYKPIITGLNIDVTLPKPKNAIEQIYYQCAKFMATEIRPYVPQALFGKLVPTAALANASAVAYFSSNGEDKYTKASSLLEGTNTSNRKSSQRRAVDMVGINLPKNHAGKDDIVSDDDHLPLIASQSIRLEVGMTTCKCTVLMISLRTANTSWSQKNGAYPASTGVTAPSNSNPFIPPSSGAAPPQPGSVQRVPSATLGVSGGINIAPADPVDAEATIKGAAAMAELTVALNVITEVVNQEGGLVYSVATGGTSVTCVWGIVDYDENSGSNKGTDDANSPKGGAKSSSKKGSGGGGQSNYASYDNYNAYSTTANNANTFNQMNSNRNSQSALAAAKSIAKRFEMLGLPRCMSMCTGTVIASHSKIGSQKCVLIVGGHIELASTMLLLLQNSKLPSTPYVGGKDDTPLSLRGLTTVTHNNLSPANALSKPLAELLIDEDTFFETPRTQQRGCKPIAILANIAGLGLGLGDNGNRSEVDYDFISATKAVSSHSINSFEAPEGQVVHTASFRAGGGTATTQKRYPSLDKTHQTGDTPNPTLKKSGEILGQSGSGHNANSANIGGHSGSSATNPTRQLNNSGNAQTNPVNNVAANPAPAGTVATMDSFQSTNTSIGKNVRTVVYTYDFSSTDIDKVFGPTVGGNPFKPPGGGDLLINRNPNNGPDVSATSNVLSPVGKNAQQLLFHTSAQQWKLYSEAFLLYRSGLIAQSIVEFKKYLLIFPRDFHAQWLVENVLKVSLQRRLQYFGNTTSNSATQNRNANGVPENNGKVMGQGPSTSPLSMNKNAVYPTTSSRGTTPISTPNHFGSGNGNFPPSQRMASNAHDHDPFESSQARAYSRVVEGDDFRKYSQQVPPQYQSPRQQSPHPPVSQTQMGAISENPSGV